MALPTIDTNPWMLYGKLLTETKELIDTIKARLNAGGLRDAEIETLLQQRDALIDLRTLLSAAVNAGDWENQGNFREPGPDHIRRVREIAQLVDAANRHDATVEIIIVAADAILSLAGELYADA